MTTNKTNFLFIGQEMMVELIRIEEKFKKIESFINIPLVIKNTKRKLEYYEFLNIFI